MARQFRLWEMAQVVNLLPAAADSAPRTSAYISVKYGHKAFLVCGVNQTNAATQIFNVLQATSLGGANSKAISNPAPIAVNLDTSTGTGSDQFTFPSQAVNYTTDAGIKNKIVIFEIDPGEVMDVNNTVLGAFNHIAVSTNGSNAGNFTSCYAIIMPLRDARQNPPTTYI